MKNEIIQFTHLHTHSPEGSLLDGFMRIDKAIDKAKRLGMDALGISDHGTMAAHEKFYNECKKAGIHPVLGMEAYLTPNKDFRKSDFDDVAYVEAEDSTEEEAKYIFSFLTEQEVEESEFSWQRVEAITPKKENTRIYNIAKESYILPIVEKTLPEGQEIPKGKAAKTRMANSYRKAQTLSNKKELYIQADTKMRDLFAWYPRMTHQMLIAMNNEGYQNLLKLNAIGQMDGFYGKPRIDFEDIKKYGKGIAATTACFLEDAPVVTTNGTKKIKDVEEDDVVVTHKGNLKKVVYKTTRNYSGNMNTIVTRGSTLNLVSTEDHKLLTFNETKGNYTEEEYEERKKLRKYFEKEMSEGGAKLKARKFLPYGEAIWKEAKDIDEGDTLLTAIDSRVEDIRYINLSSFAMETSKNPIENYILPVERDLLELLGIYAAEGSFGRNFLTFTVDSRDDSLIEFILSGVEKYFGVKGKLYKKSESNGVNIEFGSTELRNIFASWFGQTSFYKKMPEFIRHLPPKKQLHFIKGLYYCDGHSRVRGGRFVENVPKTRNEISLSTTSVSMVFDVTHIFHRNNINPSVTENAERIGSDGVHHKRNFSIGIYGNTSIELDEFVFGNSQDFKNTTQHKMNRDWPVTIKGTKYMKQEVIRKEVSYYEGDVYCLNVEDDHSFNAFGLTVHNCLGGMVPQLILRGRPEVAKKEIQRLVEAFDEVYLEIQPSRQEDQHVVNAQLIEWSRELGVPLIATTDAHMVDKDEMSIHAAMTHIGTSYEDDNDISAYDSAYLMTPEEILQMGIPREALQNAYDLSHRCQVDFLENKETKFPEYDVPEGYTMDEYLRELTEQGLFDIMLKKDYIEDYQAYQERLDYELKIISDKKLSAYFVIVWDYINYAREKGIYVGPGRGKKHCLLTQ